MGGPAKAGGSSSEFFLISYVPVSFSLESICPWHDLWPIKMQGKDWQGKREPGNFKQVKQGYQ